MRQLLRDEPCRHGEIMKGFCDFSFARILELVDWALLVDCIRSREELGSGRLIQGRHAGGWQ